MTAVGTAITAQAPAALPRAGLRQNLSGTAVLLRFILAKDRVRLAIWALGLLFFLAYAVFGFATIYADAAERQTRAALMSSPVSIMLAGPGYGLDDYTIGAMISNEMLGWLIIVLGIMNIQQVVRNTRAEEETGRAELIRSGVVGRHAPATAAFLAVLIADVVIAVAAFGIMVAGGLDATGSAAIATAMSLTALAFAAIAAVTSQITGHARGATGLGIAALGVLFMLRAFGDIQETHGSLLSWLTPIGWAQQMRAFVDLRWWPLVLTVALIVVLLVVASVLASHRDVGAGLVAARSGRADAAASLRSPFAVAWRQQRTGLMWWVIGVVVMFAASGTYTDSIGDMIEDLAQGNPAVLEIFGGEGDFVAAFIGVLLLYAGLIGIGYGIAAVLRSRGEETAGRAEVALALPVSRHRWFGAQLVVAGIGVVVLVLVSGLALAAGSYAVGVTDPSLGTYLGAAAAFLPAVAVVLGVAAALFAWIPRLAGLAWVFLAYGFFAGLLGEALELPDAVLGLSPLHWVPTVGVDDVSATPLLVLSGIAVALFVLAFAGFRRRDVPTS